MKSEEINKVIINIQKKIREFNERNGGSGLIEKVFLEQRIENESAQKEEKEEES